MISYFNYNIKWYDVSGSYQIFVLNYKNIRKKKCVCTHAQYINASYEKYLIKSRL